LQQQVNSNTTTTTETNPAEANSANATTEVTVDVQKLGTLLLSIFIHYHYITQNTSVTQLSQSIQILENMVKHIELRININFLNFNSSNEEACYILQVLIKFYLLILQI